MNKSFLISISLTFFGLALIVVKIWHTRAISKVAKYLKEKYPDEYTPFLQGATAIHGRLGQFFSHTFRPGLMAWMGGQPAAKFSKCKLEEWEKYRDFELNSLAQEWHRAAVAFAILVYFFVISFLILLLGVQFYNFYA